MHRPGAGRWCVADVGGIVRSEHYEDEDDLYGWDSPERDPSRWDGIIGAAITLGVVFVAVVIVVVLEARR